MLLGQSLGLCAVGGVRRHSVYIGIFLWFSEREYVYPAQGPLALLYLLSGGSLSIGDSPWLSMPRFGSPV